MYPRHLVRPLEAALEDTPAVMLVGARQTGKTTLVRGLAARRERALYVTLDDPTALEAAQMDPAGLLSVSSELVVIDEIQKAPGLLPVVKSRIDRARRAGRYLLTGSANVLALPRVSESLAGRIELATLWPLSQGELAGRRESFLDVVFRGDLASPAQTEDVLLLVLRGGYPEAVERTRAERRRAFFESYVTTLVTRDVRDLAAIEAPLAIRRLLQLLATRTSAVANHSEVARALGMPVSTVKRYLALLQTLFLVTELPAWSSNRGKRLVRSPKLHLADTGLAAALLGLDPDAIRADRTLLGPLLESFVVMELRKQLGWSELRPTLHHFRTHGGHEVDVVLEDPRGRIVGIEVKASATVTAADFAGLHALAELAGKKFVQGLVLHLGASALPFGPAVRACPIPALWGS